MVGFGGSVGRKLLRSAGLDTASATRWPRLETEVARWRILEHLSMKAGAGSATANAEPGQLADLIGAYLTTLPVLRAVS